MTFSVRLTTVLAIAVCSLCARTSATAADGQSYTRLKTLAAPKIIASAEAYPGGHHNAANLVDGNPATEYASANKGTNTFVEFDFGGPRTIAGFRFVDRNDPAIVAASELVFEDAAGSPLSTVPVKHVGKRAGTTFLALPTPVNASRVRWQVTELGSTHGTVGGAEIEFFGLGGADRTPAGLTLAVQPLDMIERPNHLRPVKITVTSPYAESLEATLECPGAEPARVPVSFGANTVQVALPAADSAKAVSFKLLVGGTMAAEQSRTLEPVRPLEIYLLPHSHVDIGYTALQPEVEQKQDSNIETGLRLAKATANYPEGARFKWNVEVLWPVENYLRTASPEKRREFIEAVKAGQIGLDGFYCNILTGLCRPEELIRLMSYATRVSQLCGVPIESAMISDVPGYTWSTVTAMAQAGVKYFSFAPNYFDRMGSTMKEWQNRPFWWKGADGKSRVLCWCPSRGYALGHLIGDGEALARFLPSYLVELQTNNYPYNISQLRWNVHGDNGSPDEKIADVVRDWNAHYEYPRLILSTTAEAFRAFEQRYGDKLPEFAGDYTPYWEDGAASSARETALNRASAERLVQAETLWALRNPGPFPAAEFHEAWRNVLLYSEHTWGAHNSISQPDLPFVRDQWKIKQAFALDADKQSRSLLERALGGAPAADLNAVDVYNTSGSDRTGLVTLPAELSRAGDRVVDARGKPVASQRLSTGELVFLAKDVPPLSARRYTVQAGAAAARGQAKTEGLTVSSADYVVRVDEKTGGLASLFSRRLKRELADAKSAAGLNDYFYLPGSDLKGLQRNGAPRISVKERGPLVASLVIESEAPGCKKLAREVRLVDGLDQVELIDLVDKLPIRAKEGLHLGFGFAVPDPTVRFDVGLAAVRPEVDQIPAACKNWLSVQRWVDISNDKFGVTWSPIDAPLVELGAITANLVGSQTDWRPWVQHLEPSATLYAWIMNNHWHTNYRADQEGPTVFRFLIRAHGRFSVEDAAEFGLAGSQPLVVARASPAAPVKAPFTISPDDVTLNAFKPADDGPGYVVRLFGAAGKAQKVKLNWAGPARKQVFLSDTSERPGKPAGRTVEVPAWGVVTLRVE